MSRPLTAVVAVAVAGVLSLLVAAPSGATTSTPSPTPAPTVRPVPVPAAPALPRRTVGVSLSPRSGSLVGIATPITATFTVPVSTSRRAAAEHNMHVFVNGVFSSGAWYWRDGKTAVFRAKNFWPGRARIDVRMSLAGVELARSTTYSYVGAGSTTRTHYIRTSRVLIARVNAITDRMLVYVDGVLVKNFGVSLGKAGFETRSGFKAVMEKYITRNMTSQELGLTTEHYDLWAPYSTRITPSGEFVHGAPWAASRIGRWNGSHGCTNLLTNDAKWFYYATIPGDLVVTTGTGRSMEYWNGTGAPYNMPWSLWLAHSALKGRA
ncbi:MAG TPA: L,D-transpeptidase [Candidatus Nanopelagicales bacterium]|nr:L,D-transpeptidase [Candidatus Nanopelagicales bacterium]